jgi:ribosomal protein S12 methylthiotransferase
MKPKVFLHPAACPKAAVDLEKIGWILKDAGFALVDTPAGATFGIVFGCGFIDDAKRESVEDILGLVELKQRSQLRHVVVVGCLPQKHGRSLALSLPEVDALVGIGGLVMVPTICKLILDGKLHARIWDDDLLMIGDLGKLCHREAQGERPWTRTVMVCDGCDNACTYCAIPEMRGGLRSREGVDIAEEVAELVRQGAREIVLAGQDTASYGNDKGENGLAGLLDALASRFGDTWLRLAYVNPDNLDEKVADKMAAHANICNYIDMPVQHASPRILKAMGREGPTLKRRKIDRLRKTVPDIALRTSVIVGFPGETEEDMAKLLKFLESVEFDMVGVFAFSAQPDTPASELPDRVPAEVAEERIVDIVSVQNKISHRKMEGMLGSTVEILTDELDGSDSVGHSRYDMASIDRAVRIAGCSAAPGTLVKVTLDSVSAPFEWTARPKGDTILFSE